MKASPQSPSEPIWALSESLLSPRRDSGSAPRAEPVEGVEGAFLVPGVLSDSECASLVSLCDRLGFSSGETLVEVPTEIRSNQVSLLVPPPEMAEEVARRLRPLIPSEGHGQGKRCDPDYINRRWRVYRYAPPSGGDDGSGAGFFAPHYDAAQPRSGVKDGTLIDDEPEKGVVRLSQMSVLLYLSDGHRGGHTIFYPDGVADGANARRALVSPRKGAALVFWHGRHLLSPLHEGAPLEAAEGASPKYVIRTDVLFATDPPLAQDTEWSSSSYVNAMLWAAAKME